MPDTVGRNPLLPSLQREVAQRVLAAGFARADVGFEQYGGKDNETVTALVHRAHPDYRFVFYPGPDWLVAFAPGDRTHWVDDDPGDWANVLQTVDSWLRYLKRELNVSDPWAAFVESVEPFNLGGSEDDDNNTPFTDDERQTISAQLEDIKSYLLKHAADSDTDRHAIMDGMNRANDELGKRGRIDWRTFMLGVLAELIMFGYATPEGVRYAVNLLVGSAQHLLR